MDRTKRLKTKKPMKRGSAIKRGTKPLRTKTPLRSKPRRSTSKKTAKGKVRVSRQKELLPARQDLIDQLDVKTSLIVRARRHSCVTCRRAVDLTCSHIFRRGTVATRFDVDEGGNCVVQCARCNELHSRRPQVLFGWYIRTYSLSRFEALRVRFQNNEFVQAPELAALLANYTLIIKALPAEDLERARERALKI